LIFDTTALVHAIRRKTPFEEGSISVITLIEVLRGIEDEEKRKKMTSLIQDAFDFLDVNKEVAQSYVDIYFELRKKGEVFSDADGLIAATAHSRQETLLTSDKGFLRFRPLVKVELIPTK
jgi:predicted nucleic acid-binding protein